MNRFDVQKEFFSTENINFCHHFWLCLLYCMALKVSIEADLKTMAPLYCHILCRLNELKWSEIWSSRFSLLKLILGKIASVSGRCFGNNCNSKEKQLMNDHNENFFKDTDNKKHIMRFYKFGSQLCDYSFFRNAPC